MSGTIQTHPTNEAYRSGWDRTFRGTQAVLDELTRLGEDEGPALETMCAPDEPLPLVKVTELVGLLPWAWDSLSPAEDGARGRYRFTVEFWPEDKDT